MYKAKNYICKVLKFHLVPLDVSKRAMNRMILIIII